MKRAGFVTWSPLVLMLTLSSCLMTSRISIQVLTPAKVVVPGPITKVSLADNSNLVKGRFFLQIRQGEEIKQKTKLDSTLSRAILYGCIDKLYNSPRFDFVEKYNYFKTKAAFSQRFDLLDWSKVKAICDKDTSDALIALEYFTVVDSSSKNVTYNPAEGSYEGSIVMNTYTLWRIYYPYANNRYTDITIRDTMEWKKSGWSSADVALELPDREYALEQACYKVGGKFAKTVAQQWKPVERTLYMAGSSDLRYAAELVNQKKWKEAIDSWMNSYEENKNEKKIAAALTYNVSVGYEVLDDIDKALEWAAKSYFIEPKADVERYINALEKRKAEKEEITEQLTQ